MQCQHTVPSVWCTFRAKAAVKPQDAPRVSAATNTRVHDTFDFKLSVEAITVAKLFMTSTFSSEACMGP